MSVQNQQLANETTFNTRLMSRTVDTDTIGRVDLLNALAVSGANVINIQRNINAFASASGIPINQVYNFLLTWASDIVGAPNDTMKSRIEAIVALFSGTLGHTHTGVDGDGPVISASDLSNLNYYRAAWQTQNIAALSGTSAIVTTEFNTETPGGNTSSAGVITTPPFNDVTLFLEDGTELEDANGRKVYGRLTEAAGVWTLSFYVKIAGVETAHNVTPATDFDIYYRKVFTLASLPTIEANPAFGSVDISADVPDATTTLRGLINTIAQTFSGLKTFENGLEIKGKVIVDAFLDNTTTGPTASFVAPSKAVLKYTQNGITSISAITSPTNYQLLILTNASATDAVLPHDGGANGFFHNGGQDLDLSAGASVYLMYEPTSQRWHSIGGGGGGGGEQLQETPTGAVDGVNDTFALSFTPNTSESVTVFVDGVLRDETKWSLIGQNIIFTAGNIPALGQKVYVVYSTGTGGGGGGGSVSAETEYFTLSAGDITAKKVTLAALPVGPNKVLVDVIGGTAQEYGADFVVIGSDVDWNGLGLDGFLAAGDKLRIHYFT